MVIYNICSTSSVTNLDMRSRNEQTDTWTERGRKFGPTVNFYDTLKAIFDNGRTLALEEEAIREEGDEEWRLWFMALDRAYVAIYTCIEVS